MKSTQFDNVAEFNTKFGHAVRDTPTLDATDLPMRLAIHLEETEELVTNYLSYLDAKSRSSENDFEILKYLGLLDEATARVRDFMDELQFKLYVQRKSRRNGLLPYEEDVRKEYEQDAKTHEVEILDGGADSMVTLFGFFQGAGLPLLEGFDAVHESNMSKLGPDGEPVYLTEGPKKGKIGKGPDYFPPTDKLRDLLS